MFNEKKYKNCIGHLISQKTAIVITYLLIFAIIGFGVGFGLSSVFDEEMMPAFIGLIIGAILGLIIGIFSTWRIEMKIQEAYWRIDMLNEFKKNNNTLSNQALKTAEKTVIKAPEEVKKETKNTESKKENKDK